MSYIIAFIQNFTKYTCLSFNYCFFHQLCSSLLILRIYCTCIPYIQRVKSDNSFWWLKICYRAERLFMIGRSTYLAVGYTTLRSIFVRFSVMVSKYIYKSPFFSYPLGQSNVHQDPWDSQITSRDPMNRTARVCHRKSIFLYLSII